MSSLEIAGNVEKNVARRTFPLLDRTRVCRNLFGPIDHDELSCEMRGKLREISERDQTRWNFDFEADSPLSGNYEWEEIPGNLTPVFYQNAIQNGRIRVVLPMKEEPNYNVSTFACGFQNGPGVSEELVLNSGGVSCSQGELNQENRSGALNAGPLDWLSSACHRQEKTSASVGFSRTTQITDFFSKRKKTSESKTADNTTHPGTPFIHNEQTPRKRMR